MARRTMGCERLLMYRTLEFATVFLNNGSNLRVEQKNPIL
jgi:hypothetical protein